MGGRDERSCTPVRWRPGCRMAALRNASCGRGDSTAPVDDFAAAGWSQPFSPGIGWLFDMKLQAPQEYRGPADRHHAGIEICELLPSAGLRAGQVCHRPIAAS